MWQEVWYDNVLAYFWWMCQVPLPASHIFLECLDPLHQWLIGSSQDGSHLYLPQHLAGFIAVEESLPRKVRENMTQKGRILCNKNIDMDGSSQGLGRCGRVLKCSDDLRIWRLWKFAAAHNTDICHLDLEPKDQDGVGGTTRGDQDVDLQNGSELVVVQETWHIRMGIFSSLLLWSRHVWHIRNQRRQGRASTSLSWTKLFPPVVWWCSSMATQVWFANQLSDQGESGHSNRSWLACRNLKKRINSCLRGFLSGKLSSWTIQIEWNCPSHCCAHFILREGFVQFGHLLKRCGAVFGRHWQDHDCQCYCHSAYQMWIHLGGKGQVLRCFQIVFQKKLKSNSGVKCNLSPKPRPTFSGRSSCLSTFLPWVESRPQASSAWFSASPRSMMRSDVGGGKWWR